VSSPPHATPPGDTGTAPAPNRIPRDTGFQPVQSPSLQHCPLPPGIGLFLYLLLSLSPFFTALGCCPRPPEAKTFHLNPPLRSVADVVNAINANNQKIPTLWATLNYSATIKDNKGQTHSIVSDDGVLTYTRPDLFHLIGRKELVGTVFDLGANGREFWLKLIPGANIMYVGSFVELAKASGADVPIPIRPDLVAEVLGVGTFNENLLKPPFPVMRYDGATDSYVFLFARQGDYHFFPEKEIWYDRATLRPRRVMFYDYEGIPKLDARLSSDKLVQVPSRPQSEWPVVAADFKLFFPVDGNHMEFTLKDVRLFKEGPRSTRYPNSASFQMPDATDVRVEKVTGSNAQ